MLIFDKFLFLLWDSSGLKSLFVSLGDPNALVLFDVNRFLYQ